jgi:hypothetical protein
MARQRNISPFNLSFLDIMFCGFGAVVLLVMLLNGQMVARRNEQITDLRGEVTRLEKEVTTGRRMLVELRNTIAENDEEIAAASGRALMVSESIKKDRLELADLRKKSPAEREHINKLQDDLKEIAARNKQLKQKNEAALAGGSQVRKFIGQGDRQYLTGLRLGGKRVLLLVDTSASMLDETIVNIILRRNLDKKVQRESPKWQRVLRTVDWLLANLPVSSRVQIITFNRKAGPITPELAGKWIKITDSREINRMITDLHSQIPHNGTSLYQAFAAVRGMVSKPDNILLLTDGLPTFGRKKSGKPTVSGEERLSFFEKALTILPKNIPVNTILFPLEGDPLAAAAYWRLAVVSHGSFLTPARDWP